MLTHPTGLHPWPNTAPFYSPPDPLTPMTPQSTEHSPQDSANSGIRAKRYTFSRDRQKCFERSCNR